MFTIAWLLTRMLLMRFIVILFGVCAFFLTLDIVTYADDILALHNNDLRAIGEYALLRLPGTVSNFTTLAMLLATLMVFTEISHHSEIVAIWGAGVSQFRLVMMLLPVALAIGTIHFFNDDVAVPWAAPVLHEWGIGDYSEKKLKVGEKDPIWMRSGNDVLRARESNIQATKLRDIIIFRRDDDGILIEQIMAESAEMVDGRWELSNVAIYYRENVPPSEVERLIYSGLMRPAAVGARSGDPEEMSVNDLSYFITNAGFGIRPAHVYETWLNKRFTLIFTGLLMLIIAIPLAARHHRAGRLGLPFALGILLGFGFFILDGVSITMGELGLLPPWLAAWLPLMLLSSIAGVIAFRHETL